MGVYNHRRKVEVGTVCKRCGAPVSEGWKACPSCGLRLVMSKRSMAEIVLILISLACSLGGMYIFWNLI